MAKQAERREATRKAVVKAARECFARQGFDATTMEGIAEAIGMAKGAVYHHFPSKEAVFEAAFEDVLLDLADQLRAATRGQVDWLKVMVIGTRAYFEAFAQRGLARILLYDGPAVLGWARWREIDKRIFGHFIREPLSRAMANGTIARRQLEPLAGLVVGAITEAAMACSISSDPGALGSSYADGLQALLEGLRTAAPTTTGTKSKRANKAAR
jgi:AcrR family transcriptional regulator